MEPPRIEDLDIWICLELRQTPKVFQNVNLNMEHYLKPLDSDLQDFGSSELVLGCSWVFLQEILVAAYIHISC